MSAARDLVAAAQIQISSDRMNSDLLLAEKTAAQNLEKALLLEEQLLFQKSRTKWLSLGDGNNSFFLIR